MTCVSMSDPGMVVFPTHRLFRGLPELSAVEPGVEIVELF